MFVPKQSIYLHVRVKGVDSPSFYKEGSVLIIHLIFFITHTSRIVSRTVAHYKSFTIGNNDKDLKIFTSV